MGKKETVAEIKARNGVQLNEESYSAKQLDALQAVADDRSRFDALKNEYDQAREAASAARAASETPQSDSKKRKVKLGSKVIAGGSLLHPGDKVTIGETPVAVTVDDWVNARIRNQELDWA